MHQQRSLDGRNAPNSMQPLIWGEKTPGDVAEISNDTVAWILLVKGDSFTTFLGQTRVSIFRFWEAFTESSTVVSSTEWILVALESNVWDVLRTFRSERCQLN